MQRMKFKMQSITYDVYWEGGVNMRRYVHCSWHLVTLNFNCQITKWGMRMCAYAQATVNEFSESNFLCFAGIRPHNKWTYAILRLYADISLHCASKNAHLIHMTVVSTKICWPIFISFGARYTELICNITCQLAQCDDEWPSHRLGYASSKLNATQRNWAVIEREVYFVVCPLVHYRNVIFGAPIMVYCDHKPLKYLTQSAPKSAKLMH